MLGNILSGLFCNKIGYKNNYVPLYAKKIVF